MYVCMYVCMYIYIWFFPNFGQSFYSFRTPTAATRTQAHCVIVGIVFRNRLEDDLLPPSPGHAVGYMSKSV